MSKLRLFLIQSKVKVEKQILKKDSKALSPLLWRWEEAFSGSSPEEFFRWCRRLRDAGIRFRTRAVRSSAPCVWGNTVYYIYVKKNDAPLSEQIIRK
ncbi:MAG: hypothetical protein ACOX0K_04505 [Oscillospiraceae bacterium]|jgi:hypothetical protein